MPCSTKTDFNTNLVIKSLWIKEVQIEQEDHDGLISLTWVLSSIGRQSYVPTCDPQGGASFDPRGIKWTNLVEVH